MCSSQLSTVRGTWCLESPSFFFSSRRRHTRWTGDWSSDVCSSDLSTDRNLWHCSHEGGILEDPAREPPEHIFVMTKDPLEAPDLPVVVEIGFEEGTPVSVNHVPMGPVELLESLNATAGEHGVGRADVVEDRLV